MTHVIRVATERPYDVVLGSGFVDRVAQAIPERAAKVLIVHTAVLAARAERLRDEILATGRECLLAEVPDAEAGKTAEVLAFCWQVLGRNDFHRTDVVIGFGGGAVTDLAGFVAATWLRGVDVIQVPTTLQAMVDAAVGGKTGINTAEGKNLVGAFYEPVSVWCDVQMLESQPRFDLVAGLAEVVKCGFIRDVEILDIVESHLAELSALDRRDVPVGPAELDVLGELARRAITVKADVVARDLRESYEREVLNYGHTLGHAIEYVERYQWRHGAAISVGMIFAAELAGVAGRLADEHIARHRALLGGLGLPTTYAGGRWDALLTAMRRDKKARAGALRFVVLEEPGKTARLEAPDPSLLAAAYAAITSR
jgi:3-dehydroquinate synthase